MPAYVHVSLQTRTGFRWVRTRAIGTPTGACGRIDTRTRFLVRLPRLPASGVTQAYLDSARVPSTATRRQARLTLTLRRRAGRNLPSLLPDVTARGSFDVGVAG